MSRRRLEDISEEELKRIEREIGWLMEIFYKGGIFPMKVLRRFDEETKETRIKAVKARYKIKGDIEKGIFPVNHNIVINISQMPHKLFSTERLIEWMIKFVDEESIYMYDPDGEGTGYKYYKGEKLIVYQIGPFLTRNEKFRIENQIRRTNINGFNKIINKVVIVEEKFRILDEWPVYGGSTIQELKNSFLVAWNGRRFE